MSENTSSCNLELCKQSLILDAKKVVFWKEKKMLIVSDVHLGKAGHFRKSGIPIPTEIHNQDLKKLDFLIETYRPQTVTFLGDLFHSDQNDEWNDFNDWLFRNIELNMVLIKGNHDILSEESYLTSGLHIMDEWIIEPFHLTHEAEESQLYNISGHVHPAIRLNGSARQGLRLPCFYFKKRSAILPSFGNFTGEYTIKPEKESKIFMVGDGRVIPLIL